MKKNLNSLKIMNELHSTALNTPYYEWETNNFIIKGERPDYRVNILEEKLPQFFWKDKSVLDLGCNLGRFCHYAEDKGAKNILGIEQDPNTYIAAKEIINIENKQNILLGNYDLTLIENSKYIGEYDICLAFSVLHHINPREHIFEALNKNIQKYILIETGLKEYAYNSMPIDLENDWNFKSKHHLLNYLEEKLPNFSFDRDLGISERNRYILTFKRNKTTK